MAAKVGRGEAWEVTGEKMAAVLEKKVYRPAFMRFAEEAYNRVETRKAFPKDVVAAWMEEVLRIISDSGGRNVTYITDTTRKMIRAILVQAQAEGLGIQEAARLLREKLPEINRSRARRIARTEINSTANSGTHAGMVQAADALDVQMRKVWAASTDDHTRDSHREANGQSRPMNEPFDINDIEMMHPGEFGAPAEEIINCRCTLLYEVIE